MGEFDLIDHFKKLLKFKPTSVLLDIGDDCAALLNDKSNSSTLISSDALVEKIHFDLKTHPPELLGRKSLSVNLSDIAAMGGTPLGASISLAIPKTISKNFLDKFYVGLNSISEEYEIPIVGGDTVSSPKHFFINLTVLGKLNPKKLVTRDGAKAGDILFVTGFLGDSSLGLKILKSPQKKWLGNSKHLNYLKRRHHDPTPRLREYALLKKFNISPTSMIDISDGLSQDLSHLLKRNKLGADLYFSRLPMSESLKKICSSNKIRPEKLVLEGGEDYELLFTIKPRDVKKLYKLVHNSGFMVSEIGRVTSSDVISLHPDESGAARAKTLLPRGHDHFR